MRPWILAETNYGAIKDHPFEVAVVTTIILIAAFLRLYHIRQFVIFLGDEGRDALVVKNIVFDGKLTLLGPTASVGGFYLGPVYYYFMIPWMLMFGMDPVGPAVMIAFMGITTVGLLYFLLRRWYNFFSAAIAAFFYAIAPGVVNFSRSSWNPNPLPLFSLSTIAFLYFATQID